MSWLFSQALVEEYLPPNCLDGEQSVQLNGKPTQQAYCAPDKMTVFSRLSRFGMTYKPLMQHHGEELLKSYLAAFHVPTSASQEEAQDSMESTPPCGITWRGWLAKFDPDMYLWKTAQCSFIEDSDESLAIFPASGMTRGGLLWELPTLVQTTKEEESGLWRTPDTGAGGTSGLLKQGKTRRQNGQPIQMWPTPRSCSAMAATITPESAWNEKRNPNLETIVGQRMFPTLTAHNSKEGNYPSEQNRNTPTLATHAGGQLNPMWVEWLMGWPIGWTDLKPLGTDKSLYARQPHGEYSQKDN
jgi:hypothetical protein